MAASSWAGIYTTAVAVNSALPKTREVHLLLRVFGASDGVCNRWLRFAGFSFENSCGSPYEC
jgi:hypothetical protein